jgi:hypothetical protein
VTVNAAAPPTVSLTATPASVVNGGASTLGWSATNATSCTASGGWSGAKGLTGTEVRSGLTSTTSFTLSCTGAGGTAAQTVTVNVTPITPPPTLALSANPTAILQGAASTLNWSSSNATACAATGDWTGTKVTNGSESTGTLSTVRTFTYTLSCTGAGGSATQTAFVAVGAVPAPTVTISANPAQVAQGGTSNLSWSATNASACTASGGWSGNRPTSGAAATDVLAQTTTYSLACTGPGGQGSGSTTVTVSPPPPPPPPPPPSGTATLTWTPPSLNTDGSAADNLTGFRIYFGTSPTNLTQSLDVAGPMVTTYTVTGLASGTVYFAVSAMNSLGVVGVKTNVVSKVIP